MMSDTPKSSANTGCRRALCVARQAGDDARPRRIQDRQQDPHHGQKGSPCHAEFKIQLAHVEIDVEGRSADGENG